MTRTIAVIGCGRISKTHFPVLAQIEGLKIKYACDLIEEKAQDAKNTYLSNGITVTSTDSADNLLITTAPNTVVSYVAVPTDAENGSYCYKMLIDTQTHKLYFFRKHRINSKYGAGFADFDLRSISQTRKKKK